MSIRHIDGFIGYRRLVQSYLPSVFVNRLASK